MGADGVQSRDATVGVAESTRESVSEARFASAPDAGREGSRSAVTKESEARTPERGKAAAMDLGL